MQRATHHTYSFDDFTLDLSTGCLRRHGQEVKLRPKSFEALCYLVENSGRLVSKDELMQRLWPDSFVTENSLVKCMKDVRLALADNSQHYIKTVPRRGYLFNVQVHEDTEDNLGATLVSQLEGISVVIEEEQDCQGEKEPLNQELTHPLPLGASHSSWRRLRVNRTVVTISAAMIGLLLALSYFWHSGSPKQQMAGKPKSIAVLPFKSLVADARDEALEMGVADTLITQLSNLREITVRPIRAVRGYNCLDQDPIEAGKEQSVDAVLDGSIQKSGDKIRVTVRFINVHDGTQLWVYQCNEQCTDLFTMQDLISEKVAGTLALKLTGEERKLLTKRYTENADAYQLYLKGKYFWNKRTEEGLKKGIEYFQQAIALDPNYALAYSGLAESYIVIGTWGLLPPDEAFSKGKSAALKALEIDDLLGEAHSDLGALYCSDWQWSAGEREFKRALELNANYSTGHMTYSWFLMPQGRFDEAIAEAKRAQELDPLSLVNNSQLGNAYEIAGQVDQAIEQYQKTLEMDPNFMGPHRHLGWDFLQKGEFSEAIKEYQKALLLSGGSAQDIAEQGYAFAVWGKREEAIKRLDQVKKLSKQQYVSPYLIAVIYAGLKEKDQAFEWLQNAYVEHNASLIFLRVDSRFANLRSDSRFTELLQRIGLY